MRVVGTSRRLAVAAVAALAFASLSACAAPTVPVAAPDPGITVDGVAISAPVPSPIPSRVIVKDLALLIGDSQSSGAAGVPATQTWTHLGLKRAGYRVWFAGAGGTGFEASHGKYKNYITALEKGDWRLPRDCPELIVVQGGGNDASQSKPVSVVTARASKLIGKLRDRYPESQILMIGTLSKSETAADSRRWEIDRALAKTAESLNVPFIDPAGWVTTYGAEKQMADRVHLKKAGHVLLSGVLLQRLRELGLSET